MLQLVRFTYTMVLVWVSGRVAEMGEEAVEMLLNNGAATGLVTMLTQKQVAMSICPAAMGHIRKSIHRPKMCLIACSAAWPLSGCLQRRPALCSTRPALLLQASKAPAGCGVCPGECGFAGQFAAFDL